MSWSLVSTIITALAAGVALVLGIANFLDLRRSRKVASLSARWETHQPAPFTGDADEQRKVVWLSGSSFERIVVTNHGPAVARDIDFRLVDGEILRNLGDNLFPVPLLHSGDEVHLEIIRAASQAGPRCVELAWKDGRKHVQSRTVWLSPHKLI